MLKKVASAIENIIGYLVVVAICLVTYGVTARMLNIPVAWTDELLRAIIIWLIFIPAAVAYKTGNLIGLDLVEEMLSKYPGPFKVLKVIQHVAAIIFGAFMTQKMFLIVSMQFSTRETTPVVNIPLWVINLGAFIGGFLFLVFALQKMYLLFRPGKTE